MNRPSEGLLSVLLALHQRILAYGPSLKERFSNWLRLCQSYGTAGRICQGRHSRVGSKSVSSLATPTASPRLAPCSRPKTVRPFRYRETTTKRRRRVEPTPFVNDTRWGGLSEWIAFLGAALTGPKIGLVPKSFFHRTACSRRGVCATMAEPTFQRGLT